MYNFNELLANIDFHENGLWIVIKRAIGELYNVSVTSFITVYIQVREHDDRSPGYQLGGV